MSKRKKRVLFIGSFKSKGKEGNVGGQMYACTSLVNSNLKDRVDWILIDTTATSNLKRSFINKVYNSFFRLGKTLFYLLFYRVDTVMAFCSTGNSFLEKGAVIKVSKRLGKRTILAPRSGHLIDDINNNTGFKKGVNSIFKSCDAIICQGTFWKSFFKNEFQQPEDKLIVIHNWIDTKKYFSKKPEISNPVKILFLGWVDKNKGIWDIYEAGRVLDRKDFIFQIAGNGNDFEQLDIKIKANGLEGRLNLLNWVYGQQKFDLLREADIFVLPSYREGLPNSLLEAMASSCAIITTNVGAIPDIIEHNVNGIVIKPNSPNELVGAINSYLDNRELIKIHTKNALQTVIEKNSIELIESKFYKILELDI